MLSIIGSNLRFVNFLRKIVQNSVIWQNCNPAISKSGALARQLWSMSNSKQVELAGINPLHQEGASSYKTNGLSLSPSLPCTKRSTRSFSGLLQGRE